MSRAATARHAVDQAISEGRIAPAQRAGYIRLYDSDPDGTRALLARLAPAVPLGEVGGSTPEGGEGRVAPDDYPKEWLAGDPPAETGPGSITRVND
jgi:hypothetical protein